MKELSEMTLQELWQLFPIRLTEQKAHWQRQYSEMEDELASLFGKDSVRISHIGSTAIPEIMAKDIVDVLVEFPETSDLQAAASLLLEHGFIEMSSDENRISLNKGYTKNGFAEKVFHIHLRKKGDNDELYFRDYLIEFPDKAVEYEDLKKRLAVIFHNDRDQYTEGKSAFIQRITRNAKKRYPSRY